MALRHDQDEAVAAERIGLEPARIDRAGDDADIADAFGDQADDLVGEALLQVDADLRVAGQKGAERLGQELRQGVGVGEDPDLARQPAGIGAEILAQALGLGQHRAGVLEEGPPGRRRSHALAAAQEERSAERLLHVADAGAGGRQRQMGPLGPVGDAARLDHVAEQAQIGQIELHGASFVIREGR